MSLEDTYATWFLQHNDLYIRLPDPADGFNCQLNFVLTAAAGQCAADKESAEDLKKAVFGVWTIKYAFFADMGGTKNQPT